MRYFSQYLLKPCQGNLQILTFFLLSSSEIFTCTYGVVSYTTGNKERFHSSVLTVLKQCKFTRISTTVFFYIYIYFIYIYM